MQAPGSRLGARLGSGERRIRRLCTALRVAEPSTFCVAGDRPLCRPET